MRFSVGVYDACFGKKVAIEVPSSDGSLRKVRVTKKWLQKMKEEGRITDLPAVKVHMLNVSAIETVTWFIGKDVSIEDFEKFRDPQTDDLYAMLYYKEGQQTVSLMSKSFWEYTALQSGISTGLSEEEAQKIKTEVEETIVSRGAKLPGLFN